MTNYKFQVWEGELEMPQTDENETSIFSVAFASIIGISLFFMLLAKTALQIVLESKRRKNIFRLRSYRRKLKLPRDVGA